jgi:hypothetical protein
MPPTLHGSADSTTMVQYTDSPGGTLRNVTSQIRTIGGLKIEQITEENSPFGATSEAYVMVGKQKFADVQMDGDWDTTALTGSHAVFGTPDTDPNGATRSLVVTPGGSKTLTVPTRLVSFEIKMVDSKITGYAAVVRQAGLAVWS